jgi:hypothetical protein
VKRPYQILAIFAGLSAAATIAGGEAFGAEPPAVAPEASSPNTADESGQPISQEEVQRILDSARSPDSVSPTGPLEPPPKGMVLVSWPPKQVAWLATTQQSLVLVGLDDVVRESDVVEATSIYISPKASMLRGKTAMISEKRIRIVCGDRTIAELGGSVFSANGERLMWNWDTGSSQPAQNSGNGLIVSALCLNVKLEPFEDWDTAVRLMSDGTADSPESLAASLRQLRKGVTK